MPDNQHVPHDASFEKALANGLKRQPGPGTNCPDAETLAAFWDQSLALDERQLWEAHCATCARCQAHLAALAQTETVEEELGDSDTSRFAWLIDWRWIAPMATAAVVLLAVWGIDPAPVTEQATSTVSDFDLGAAGSDAADVRVQSPQVERLERRDVAEAEREDRERRENLGAQENQQRLESEVDTGLSPDEAPALDEVVPGEPGNRETLGDTADTARSRRLAPTAEAELAERRLSAQPPQANASGTTASIAAASPASGVVSVIDTPDDSVRWRLLAPGRVEHSIDGGVTWSLQLSDIGTALSAGSAPSVLVCWIVGQGGAIFRTVDGGETWIDVTAPRQVDLTGVNAENAESATIDSIDGMSYSTHDGGLTWEP